MNDLQVSAKKLKESFSQVKKHNIKIEKSSITDSLINFKASRSEYIRNSFLGALNEFKKRLRNIQAGPEAVELQSLVCEIKGNDYDKIGRVINRIEQTSSKVKSPAGIIDFRVSANIPAEIKSDVEADLKELQACFDAGLYRSAVILCGRILETILHRKYYDSVGVDLLEKSPGIGLGKIIAKLAEKEVELDPALKQQIHLINQVRIFTVHKKKNAFQPSKTQANAMILYTLDILEKMF